MAIITRKIQLNFDITSRTELKDCYDKVYAWQRICYKSANQIVTHHFVQENIKELFYLAEGVKVKLANVAADENGILSTSAQNTTYQALSKRYKGECPMAMLAGLNSVIVQTYKKESRDVTDGKKSLRSYRQDIPIPAVRVGMRNFSLLEDGNYSFLLYGIPVRTYFGRDLSGNKALFDSALAGQHKFCDSTISIKKNKVFLNATFNVEVLRNELDENKYCFAELDVEVPIKGTIEKWAFEIGNKDEFLHRRLAIQGALRQTQISSRYNRGGHGRKQKLQATDRFRKLEKHYIETRVHQYTSKLVHYCIKNKCGTLVLVGQLLKEDVVKNGENGNFLLRNWGYYGMKDKLQYKCSRVGIKLIDGSEKEKDSGEVL